MKMSLFFPPILAAFLFVDSKAQNNVASDPVYQNAEQAYHEGRIAEAETGFMSLLERFPSSASLKNNLAAIAARRGNLAEAEKILRGIINSDAIIATAYNNLTALYAYQAAESYRSALLLDAEKSPLPEFKLAGEKRSSLPSQDLQTQVLADDMIDKPLIEDPVATRSKNTDAVLEAIKLWAQLWSNQDLETYLNSYAKDFKGRQKSRDKWLNLRAARVQNPRFIKVKLSHINANVNGRQATVTFTQDYSSNLVKSRVRKLIKMRLIDNTWKITSERVSS